MDKTTIRIFFEKRDRAKYISHLDITRCFSRTFARSGIPVWYTQGFNPRVYMTFPLPIPLGYESLCESLDIQLVEENYPLEQVKERLNAILPAGITVLEVVVPQDKPETIALADYQIRFLTPQPEQLLADFAAFAAQEAILVTKKTKKAERELDLRPLFTLLDTASDGEAATLTLRLAAGITLNVNPQLLLDAFAAHSGRTDLDCRVLRTAILRQDGSRWN